MALAHSSMMSDILRGVQRHRGMPAVMLRQTPVTMRLTSLTPASVREQQTLLRLLDLAADNLHATQEMEVSDL